MPLSLPSSDLAWGWECLSALYTSDLNSSAVLAFSFWQATSKDVIYSTMGGLFWCHCKIWPIMILHCNICAIRIIKPSTITSVHRGQNNRTESKQTLILHCNICATRIIMPCTITSVHKGQIIKLIIQLHYNICATKTSLYK